MANLPDKKIIEYLKSDDSKKVDAILNHIMKKYKRSIVTLLISRSAKLEDAEEAFSDSIFILLKNIRKGLLDRPDSSIEPYLKRICRNLMWTKFNKRIDFEDLDLPDIQNISIETNHLDFLLNEERKKIVTKVIQQLRPKCQDILLRFYWYEQKMKIIAEQMGYANEQVARNKKAKCLNKVRNLLGGNKSPFFD